MTTEKKFDREKILNILDIIILTGLFIIVFNMAISTTTLMIQIPYGLVRGIMWCLTAIVAIKVILKHSDRNIWVSLPVAAVYLMVYFTAGYEFMIFLAIFTVGLNGIHYRKILGVFIVPAAIVLFTSMFASLSGAITNFVIAGGMDRSAWGSCYYTEFASALFFLLLFFWIFLKNIPDVLFIIPGVIVLFLSSYISGSRTATTLSVVFLGFIVYKILEDKYLKINSRLFWVKRAANAVVRFCFPVLFIFMVIMLFLYRKGVGFAKWYDEISMHRLVSASRMIDEYGIRPFGSFFEMSGNGWSTFETLNYTFIDSSYLQLLIRYGLVAALFVTVLWVWMSDRVLRSGNRRMAFAMLLIAIDSMSEQHFTELNYNILLAMPFAFLDTAEANADAKLSEWLGDAVTKKFRTTQFLAITAGVAVLIYFLPAVFSYYRTIFNGYGFTDGNQVIDGVAVFVICFVSLALMTGFIWFFSKLIATDALEKAISKKYLLLTIATVIFMLIGVVVVDGCVDRVYEANLSRIAGEASIVGNITAYAKGKVYADRFPEAYKKQFAGIDRSFYDGEDMARLKAATVIVDADFDSACFENAGFSYLKISDEDAIYTNDKSVIELLEGEGCEFAHFNNSVHELDLRQVAGRNGLEVSEDGSILLSGSARSLVFGPFLDLHPGRYEVTFALTDPDAVSGEAGSASSAVGVGDALGDIRVSSYWGENVAADIQLTPAMFDENGKLTNTVDFEGNGRGYEFLIFMKDNKELLVDKITYRRLG